MMCMSTPHRAAQPADTRNATVWYASCMVYITKLIFRERRRNYLIHNNNNNKLLKKLLFCRSM